MMDLKKTVLFFTIFIVILSSCSLQKRHYTQGYHIEWEHTKRKIGTSEIAGATAVPKVQSHQFIENEGQINLVSSKNKQLASVSGNKSIVLTPPKKVDPAKGVRSQFDYQNESELKTSFKNSTEKSDDGKKKGGAGIVGGILLMLLALLLVGLGYVFYTNLGVFFGTFFFLIFGIGGAIFFIIGLVAFIVGLTSK